MLKINQPKKSVRMCGVNGCNADFLVVMLFVLYAVHLKQTKTAIIKADSAHIAAQEWGFNKNLWKIFQKADTANGVIIAFIMKTNLNIFAESIKNGLIHKAVEVLDIRRLSVDIA